MPSTQSNGFVDHDPPHPCLECCLALETRSLLDRLCEGFLDSISPCRFVADDRGGCPNEPRQVGSVQRLQLVHGGSAKCHLRHTMRGAARFV
jgi:hypothetical protein